MKHTSGPWFWTASCYEGTMITASMGEQIAMWPPQGGTVEQCANARLIAAAPDMMEALNQIVEVGITYPPNWETFTAEQRLQFPPVRSQEAKIALAALAKAKGE